MEKIKKATLLIPLLFALLTGCHRDPGIEGLWLVQSVQMGDKEMTPNARWMEFHADGTQQSGNGKLAHSYGIWSLDKQSGELTIQDQNGLHDPNGPFVLSFKDGKMYWQRMEDGQEVKVTLVRTDHLPETYGDQLKGIWKLEEAGGSSNYFTASDTGVHNTFVFFRWDRRFVMGTPRGRINGVYNVHGHRPELELIPYGEGFQRDFWSFAIDKDTLSLRLLNSDSTVTMRLTRIHAFPE
ncbi:MAG: hypothetical protein P8100_13130 [bacterium]